MARSSPPKLPTTEHAAPYKVETFRFLSPVGLGILVGLFGVVAVSGAALVLQSSPDVANTAGDGVATASAQDTTESDVPNDQPDPTSQDDETPTADKPAVTETTAPENEASPESEEGKNAAIAADETGLEPAADQQAPTVNASLPLDDVRTKARLLSISGTESDGSPVSLCSIVGVPARNIQLELVGNEFTDRKRVTLTLDNSNDGDSLAWKVTQKPASALERPVALGQFEFSDERLSFLAPNNSKNSLLEFCLLRIRTTEPSDTELCRLWKPLQLQDLSMTFEDARTVYNLIPDNLPQLPANELRLAIESAGCGDCEFPVGKNLTFGNPVTVDVMNGNSSDRSKLFTTRYSLTAQDSRPLLVVSHFAMMRQVTLRNNTPSIGLSEQPLSTLGLAALRRSGLRQQTDITKLIDGKSRLLSRATSSTVKRELDTEVRTLIAASSALDELATHVAALKETLDEIAGSGRTGLRLVRRISDENEIVILETELFSEQQ